MRSDISIIYGVFVVRMGLEACGSTVFSENFIGFLFSLYFSLGLVRFRCYKFFFFMGRGR